MRDVDRNTIEAGRPARDVLACINACLEALDAEPHKSHLDKFASNMTYEELWGTLLLARDEIELARSRRDEETNY
jgi:hypothetical protein